MNESASPALVPLRQSWPPALVARYRAAGHWRGETLPGVLRERATLFADDIAVVGREVRLSYAALWQEAGRIGAGLLARGLVPGDRVVVQLGNTPAFVTVVCGLFRAGLIPVYALPAHRFTEVRHVLDKAQARGYIAADRQDGFDYRVLARELQALLPALQHVLIVGDAAEFGAVDSLQGDAALLPPDPDPQSVAFLQLSGGSTGLSKLIPRTHDDYIYSFRASNDICGITRDSVYMVALPAAHNFPMSSPGFLGALYAGARVVMSPGPGPDAAFPLIARERVTCVGLVPPLALLWAQAAATTAHDLGSLQVLQVGGAKLVPEAAHRVIDSLGCRLQQVFGMAEGLVNYTRLHDPLDVVVGTQGRPISPDDEVLVVDDHGHPVAEGGIGHLLTRGPYTIRAYHNDPAANARSFTEDGYYRTGDMVQQLPVATWWCRAGPATISTGPARRSPPRRSKTICWPMPRCSMPRWSRCPMPSWGNAAVRSSLRTAPRPPPPASRPGYAGVAWPRSRCPTRWCSWRPSAPRRWARSAAVNCARSCANVTLNRQENRADGAAQDCPVSVAAGR